MNICNNDTCKKEFVPRRGALGRYCSHKCSGEATIHLTGKDANRYTHGLIKTRAYKSWCGIKYRCNNKKDNDYGARGITYDPRWEKFENFFEDMGECLKGMSIDRIDVNGNYCKENCRWASMKQQQRNKRNNVLFEYKNKKATLAEWADILGMKKSTLYQRYHTYKWPIDKVLSTNK